MSKLKSWLPTFGFYLKEIRKHRGMRGRTASEEISSLIGRKFPQSLLTPYEQGQVKDPARDVLVAMSLIYEVDFAEMISVLVHDKYGIVLGAQLVITGLELRNQALGIINRVLKELERAG